MVNTLARAQRLSAPALAIVLLSILTVMSGTAAAAPASASTALPTIMSMDPAMCSDPSVPDQAKSAANCGVQAADWNLPVNRWTDAATGLHLRGGDGIITDFANRLQRDATYPMLMGIGNSMWSLSAGATTAATRLDLLTIVGAEADQAAGAIGDALFSSGLVMVLVVVAIGGAIWRSSRGRGTPWKHIGKTIFVVIIMAVMLNGARASGDVNGTYQPGKFSPGWIVTQSNTIIATLASAPATALSLNTGAVSGANDNNVSGPASCTAYAQALNDDFTASVNRIPDPLRKAQASVPMLMSRMWESTGLEAWKVSQFGGSNEYADFMYCRLLEQRAGVTAGTQIALTQRSGAMPAPNANSAAWGTSGDNDAEDRNLIAWSLCRPASDGSGWAVAGDWGNVERGNRKHTPNPDDCEKWWNDSYFVFGERSTGGIIDRNTSNLEFSGKASDTISDTSAAPQARDFLVSLHGAGSGISANLVLVWTYVVSAFICMIVFLLISGAVLIAKIASVVMIIIVFIVALLDLLPGRGDSSTLAKYFKSYLGIAFVAFGTSLIFAFIAMMTGFLVQVAAAWFGGANPMTMLWTGLAPLISVLLLHFVFKKVLKLPSPFSLSGAQSWAAAAGGGAIGGAMGAGVTNSLQNRGKGMAMSAGKAAAGKMSGGRIGNGSKGPKNRPGGFSEHAMNGSGAVRIDPGATGPSVASGGAGVRAAVAQRTGRMAPGGAPVAGEALTAAERKAARLAKRDAKRTTPADAPVSLEKGSKAPAPGTTGDAKTVDGWLDASGDKVRAKDAERTAARAAADEVAIGRRGYAGGAVGDLREAVSQRLSDIGAKYTERPVRASLTTAAKAAGGAGLIVATGGMAAPLMAGVAMVRQPMKLAAARRFAVENGNARVENAKAAANALAEKKAREAKRAKESTERRAGEVAPTTARGSTGAAGPATPAATGTAGAGAPARTTSRRALPGQVPLNGKSQVVARGPRGASAARAARVRHANPRVASGARARRAGTNVQW